MLKSCFLTLQEIVVVEKTQVFHYCEPARGREKERISLCGSYHDSRTKPAKAQRDLGEEGRHSTGLGLEFT